MGDTAERVGRQGRSVVEYSAKMKAMGIDERGLAGKNNPIADHVATMGQDKMRLLPGVPAAPSGVASAEGRWGKLEIRGLLTTGWCFQSTALTAGTGELVDGDLHTNSSKGETLDMIHTQIFVSLMYQYGIWSGSAILMGRLLLYTYHLFVYCIRIRRAEALKRNSSHS